MGHGMEAALGRIHIIHIHIIHIIHIIVSNSTYCGLIQVKNQLQDYVFCFSDFVGCGIFWPGQTICGILVPDQG